VSDFYRRQGLASELAGRLLKPGLLDEGLRSGLFLVGNRRTGKTTFLRNDLIPELKSHGAVVVYVDLWSDTRASPATLLHTAVRQSIADLSNPLRRRHQDHKPEEGPATLADNLTLLVDHSRADVVLIVDEVIQAIQSDEGNHMLLAIKAARDAINTRSGTPGHFLLVGSHSQHAMLNDLTSLQDQAFAGATVLPYPLLDRNYVRHVLDRLHSEGMAALPSEEGAWAAFQALECRPEEFLRALRQLHGSCLDLEPEQQLQAIVSTQRSAMADLALLKVEQTGELARAIFDWIAACGGAAQGLFPESATAAISAAIGRRVSVEELHLVVHELIGANLIRRLGHGDYIITDPMARDLWRSQGHRAGPGSAGMA
jgi:hypothetical protein